MLTRLPLAKTMHGQESMLALTAGPQQAALPGKVEEKVETLALSRLTLPHAHELPKEL